MKSMKKGYIIDDGIVRPCSSNIAKMNIFEYIYYKIFHWKYFTNIFSLILECVGEFFNYGFGLVWNLLCLIFTPITLIIYALIHIRNAKKVMERGKND